jgi:hypothetical protein
VPELSQRTDTVAQARKTGQGGNLEKKNEPESTCDFGLPGAPLRDKDAAHE